MISIDPDVRWQWSSFDSLTARQFHDVLALRAEVFVVEQQCIYQDIDGLDCHAWHLMGWSSVAPTTPDQSATPDAEQLVAYLRVVLPGYKYEEPSIGRVVTARPWRGHQLGRKLMSTGINKTLIQYPGSAIRISAQQHLSAFYGSLGFAESSAPYDEDGIEHVQMLRPCGD